MKTTQKLTNLQIEMLEVFNYELSEEQIKEIRSLLADYFAEKVTNDVDKLFKEKNWGEKRFKNGQKNTCEQSIMDNEGRNRYKCNPDFITQVFKL